MPLDHILGAWLSSFCILPFIGTRAADITISGPSLA
jgi:hypothetical protein